MEWITNSPLAEWLSTELLQSPRLAQIRTLLTTFGVSTVLLYLSTEVLGKIAAQVRSTR